MTSPTIQAMAGMEKRAAAIAPKYLEDGASSGSEPVVDVLSVNPTKPC